MSLFQLRFPPINLSLLQTIYMRHASTLLIVLTLQLASERLIASVEVPERPANYLLDQGKMFPPEVASRLVASLEACARDYDIHIYVLTVPTLQVMPSRVREKLEELGTAVTESWTKDQVGGVIVFDNEAGWVTVSASDEAERVFSAVAINLVFRNPLVDTRKKHLSPEKLEAAAMVLVNGMVEMRIKANKEESRRMTVRIIVGSVLFGALIIGLLGTFRKQSKVSDTNEITKE